MARADLTELVAHATRVGVYSNLITSGVLLDETKLVALVEVGLNHVQLSFQGLEEPAADTLSGFKGGVARKRAALASVRAADLALTLNFVVTRQNADQLDAMLAYAAEQGIARVEVANTQYYGWGQKNRAALMPSENQLDQMSASVAIWRERLKGRMVIDYVMPDGTLLPRHAAETLKHLKFPKFPASTLAEAWFDSPSFAAYRGTDWMPEPCSSCEDKEKDWGGCRCQALALAGDAGTLDPACERSPQHHEVIRIARFESKLGNVPLQLRRHSLSSDEELRAGHLSAI